MPYIGKSPVGGGFHKLDNLTASATATYALTLGGAAYYPETANQLLVSLNGVIQAPQDSFTVSGSNLIFDTALTASDSIDFVVALGDVLGVGSVTDGAVTTNKIANGAVTDAKIAAMSASKLSGALPAIDGSALTGISGIGVGQTWTNVTSSRSTGTTYTNSTGSPIFVSVSPTPSGGLVGTFNINGSAVAVAQNTPSGGGGGSGFTFIIPNNDTYSVTNNANFNVQYWWELR